MSFWYNTSLIKTFLKFPPVYLARLFPPLLNPIVPTPVDVSLKVTERCNSRCITCNIWKEQAGKPELTLEELEDIFRQLKSVKVKSLGFYGGEPLLRDDIGEVARRAKAIMKEVRILLITNGLLLQKKAQEVLESGIDFVCISLDGIGEVNDMIRGVPGYYQRVLEGISELQRIDTEKRVNINIGSTLVSPNIHQVPELIELARKLGISWSFNLFDTSAYHFTNLDDPLALKKIDDKVIDETIDYMIRERKKSPRTMVGIDPVGLEFARTYLKGKEPPFRCVLGYIRVYIDSFKNVYSGCWALPPVGNLNDRDLKSLLKSPEYRRRLKKMYRLECPYCTCGYLINLLVNRPLSGIGFMVRNVSLVRN